MKHYLYISVSFGLWLLTVPAQAAPTSADDFLPPVQASTPEQQQHHPPSNGLSPQSRPALRGRRAPDRARPRGAGSCGAEPA